MHWIGATVSAALPAICVLLLGTAPAAAQDEDGACFEANSNLECVRSEDLVRESRKAKDGSLRAVDIRDESEAFFDLSEDSLGIPQEEKVYAEVVFKPAEDGSLIVTGSANVRVSASSEGTVECELKVGRKSASVRRLKSVAGPFRGSANDSSRPFGTIAFSTVVPVRKIPAGKAGRPRKLAMVCKPGAGTSMSLLKPAITVVFHPLTYFKIVKKR